MKYKKISIKKALKPYEGNKAALARALGVHRSLIGKWEKRNNGYLPELYTWRYLSMHPAEKE